MENKIELPVVVKLNEAKNELVQCVNNIIQTHQLPCYLLEPIMKDIYIEIKAGANNELAMAKAQIENTKIEGAE